MVMVETGDWSSRKKPILSVSQIYWNIDKKVNRLNLTFAYGGIVIVILSLMDESWLL